MNLCRERLWELLSADWLRSSSHSWQQSYHRFLHEEGTDAEMQRRALLLQLWTTQVRVGFTVRLFPIDRQNGNRHKHHVTSKHSSAAHPHRMNEFLTNALSLFTIHLCKVDGFLSAISLIATCYSLLLGMEFGQFCLNVSMTLCLSEMYGIAHE